MHLRTSTSFGWRRRRASAVSAKVSSVPLWTGIPSTSRARAEEAAESCRASARTLERPLHPFHGLDEALLAGAAEVSVGVVAPRPGKGGRFEPLGGMPTGGDAERRVLRMGALVADSMLILPLRPRRGGRCQRGHPMIGGKRTCVVLAAHSAGEALEKTATELDREGAADIIVVDDASHDSTSEIARRLALPARAQSSSGAALPER